MMPAIQIMMPGTFNIRSLTMYFAFAGLLATHSVLAFLGPVAPSPARKVTKSSKLLRMSTTPGEPDDPELQWQLFKRYHARGSWKGIWTTYDYIGDVLTETVASVDLEPSDDNTVTHVHRVVAGAKRSDCATCFDSMETKDIPVATYTKESLAQKKIRLASNSLVFGPSLMRSGVMASELVLSQGDARVRVIFQHAPVWEKGVEPGSCPPQGLKLVRTMISRECLRDTPPTAETEATDKPGERGNPTFYRPVPPFNWHKVWGGTSWTWGENNLNQGWTIERIEEGDDWHGSAPVEMWNLRLPGGVFVQAPRVIVDSQVGLCRLAWLPDDTTLLRVEAGISALQPMFVEDETMVGFEPPALTSLRYDSLNKLGDLEGDPAFVTDQKRRAVEAKTPPTASNASGKERRDSSSSAATADSTTESKTQSATPASPRSESDNDGDSGLQAIRDAIQL